MVMKNRDAVKLLSMSLANVDRKSGRFTPEDEQVGIRGHVCVQFLAEFGEKGDLFTRKQLQEIVERVVDFQIEIRPIIQAGSPQILVACPKSKGLDEMQTTGRARGESPNTTGILRNFWLKESDMHVSWFHDFLRERSLRGKERSEAVWDLSVVRQQLLASFILSQICKIALVLNAKSQHGNSVHEKVTYQ
jgi:hypothetical protein